VMAKGGAQTSSRLACAILNKWLARLENVNLLLAFLTRTGNPVVHIGPYFRGRQCKGQLTRDSCRVDERESSHLP